MHQAATTARKRETNTTVSFDEFLASARAHLAEWHAYYARICENLTDINISTIVPLMHSKQMRDEIHQALVTISSPQVTPAAVKEITRKQFGKNDLVRSVLSRDPSMQLFDDWDFQQTTYPDITDFQSVPPRHAYCYVRPARKLFFFATVAAPTPDPAIRTQILDHTRLCFEQRHAQRKTETENKEHVDVPPRTHLDTEDEQPPPDFIPTDSAPPKRRTPKPKKPKRAPINF